MVVSEWKKDGFTISTDKTRIDITTVHGYLVQSYWASGIPVATVQRSIDNSFCFGVYRRDEMVGFARVITDFATFAYLADVFILPGERGKGLSKWLMNIIINYPRLQGLRRFLLATKDAHGLYAQYGFTQLHSPERWMHIQNLDVYMKKEVVIDC